MQSLNGVKYRFGRGTPANCLPVHGNPGASFASDAGTLFNFNNIAATNNRPTNSVSVENIPNHINRREILALFSTLIGEIRSYQDIRDGLSAHLDITFVDRDAAAKALCMNGYTVAGAPLSVSALTISPPTNRSSKHATDDRRNLYVLGLPFALSKNEFASLFAQYGTVSHCVILATVDNSSRRRGFVANLGLTSLSLGFLDGGDRAMLLDSRSHMPSPSPTPFERQRLTTCDSSDSSLESHDADPASLTTSTVPTTPGSPPLFFPFGHIEKLEIVQFLRLYQIEARYVRPTRSGLLDLDRTSSTESSIFESLWHSELGYHRYDSFSNSHSRQSSLSAKHPAFSNVFDGFNDATPISASSSWGFDQIYGP
ncbi:hypothetical protein BDZ97DRAFT_1813400, partial [Flammula alnicola]